MATLLKVQPLRETHNWVPKSTSEFGDESGAMNGPFRATQRWNSIIKHLQTNVSVKPHKTKTKRYEGCFAGADAVDVLLPFLQQSGFERDISRENAVKLCQLLLEQSIFEDVLAVSQLPLNMKPTFQDSSAQFYRFVRDVTKGRRSSPRLSDMARCHTKERSAADEGSSYPHFDRKKKLRHSFGAGKSKNDHGWDENDGGPGLANPFDRKKKKRSSFGLGKLKVEVSSRKDEGNNLNTPMEKKKRKRNSFGLGRLKTDNSCNICGSVESIPRSEDKRRASFRLRKHKMESNDSGSQESLSQPEVKKSRRSSFRLGKRPDTRNKDLETASITSEASRQSETNSTSSGKSSQSGDCDVGSVQSVSSRDSLRAEIDTNEVWKESTIQRLLELVDIPMLEDILSCTENFVVPSQSRGSAIKGGNSGHQEAARDQWLSSALACLNSHPDSPTITDSFLSADNSQSQSAVHARKLLLFQTLSNHVGGAARRRPLVPPGLREVLTAILGSIARGRTSWALELAQLAWLMTDVRDRDELERLLRFMSAASCKTAVKLSYEIDNRITVITTFTPAIIPGRVVSSVQAKNLVAFMMDCVDRVCTVPLLVATRAQRRIARLRAGQPDISGGSCCIRVTPQQYHLQRTAGTEAALRDLTNAVIDDVRIPLKEKRQHLHDLRKHHPAVYDKHFANML